MAWTESVSPSFRARHESEDADDVAAALEAMERLRDRLDDGLLERTPGDVTAVFHPTPRMLDLACPLLPAARRAAAPAARRYMAGWLSGEEIHTLAPRALRERASRAPGSLEMLLTQPAALYARLAIQLASPRLPPPATPQRVRRALRWLWLVEGTARHLAGQAPHAHAAIARRLHEGEPPRFPPAPADAPLLGLALVDLIAREEGIAPAVRLAIDVPPGPPQRALAQLFGGRSLAHTERAWRSHLQRLMAGAPEDDR